MEVPQNQKKLLILVQEYQYQYQLLEEIQSIEMGNLYQILTMMMMKMMLAMLTTIPQEHHPFLVRILHHYLMIEVEKQPLFAPLLEELFQLKNQDQRPIFGRNLPQYLLVEWLAKMMKKEQAMTTLCLFSRSEDELGWGPAKT